MALDERYIVASDIEQFFVDKVDGLPLANGKIKFFKDIARTVPKAVFQLSGSPPAYTYTSMGSVITLSAVGTVQNSGGDNEVIYYYPYDDDGNLELYYIQVFDENDVPQFTREAWPNITNGSDPTRNQVGLHNQISNPTFTNVFINEDRSTTFSVSSATNEVFEFAPNWDFVISGTGNVTVQRIAVTGNDKVPTSPPYILDVQVGAGITACYLRQRYFYNSGLWASTSNVSLFLSGSVLVRNENLGTTGIQMFYNESSGGTPVTIIDGTFESSYKILTGASTDAIPLSNDTNSGRDGFVDIYLSFTSNSHVRVSAVQVVPTTGKSIDLTSFDLDSSNRNEAFQGDYYIPRNNFKRVSSYLVGWDFPLNPYQFGTSGSVGTTADYIADQTIALRQSGGAITYQLSATTNGLTFVCAGTNNSFYIQQYLSGAEVKAMIGTRLSVNVFSYFGAANDAVTARIYLYRGSSAATIPTLPTNIATLAVDGTLTLTAANWTLIPRSGLDIPTFNLKKISDNTEINSGQHDYGFSGWEIVDATQIGDTDKFAIFVTFHYPDASTQITVNSVSLISGDIPCRPAIESKDEVLRKCQYYYEKTYSPNTPIGSITEVGNVIHNAPLVLNGGNDDLYAKTFSITYKTAKRSTPDLSFYSPTSATLNLIHCVITVPGGGDTTANQPFNSFWNAIAINEYSVEIEAISATLLLARAYNLANQGYYQFHYVIDSRLGIV